MSSDEINKEQVDDLQEGLDVEEAEPDMNEDADGAKHVTLTLRRHLTNRRIDKYLHHRFPDFSRTLIQRLVKEKAVTVNGQPTKSSYKLDPGDKIHIILPPPQTNEIPGEDIPLNIIYEDEYLLVLNKQSNMIVHPARGNKSGTLVNGLVFYSDSLSNVNGNFRPGIVHRLDRNTTGVMVVAKTDTAHWRLAHQFEHRLTKKVYKAIVHGTLDLDADQLDMPLARHPKVREKYAVVPAIGKQAVTTYHVLERYQGYSFVKLLPKTGRTHQLRVHMSTIKHSIVADDMYGGKTMTLQQLAGDKPLPVSGEDGYGIQPDSTIIDRQALHAAELFVRHPITGKEMHFIADLPEDMKLTLKLLEKYRPVQA